MKHRWICAALAAVMLLSLLAGCGDAKPADEVAETSETQTGEDNMLTNEQLLIKKLGLSEERAKGACEKLEDAGVPALKKAGWVSGKKGSLASVTDENGEKYTLAFGGLGFLETIVRDSDNRYLYFELD